MFAALRLFALVCALARFLAAQADPTPRFEVASLKPIPTAAKLSLMALLGDREGGPGTEDPTRFAWHFMALSQLISTAYSINAADLAGPGWATKNELDSDRFDLAAKLPPGTSAAQFEMMLQNLLAERFELKAHREKREAPAFALVPAKDGPKIKESPALAPGVEPGTEVDVESRGEDGFPITPPGYQGLFVHVASGHTLVKFIRYSMSEFAEWTRGRTHRPGIDRTGLTGRYDFYLEYGNELGVSTDSSEPLDQAQSFMSAVQSQLGLKLESVKGEVEILVIDSVIRKPTEN